MTLSNPASSPIASQSERLTLKYLFWFSLPLALTFLMMSGSAPLVTIGITWMHDADGERIHLSAFLITFATSIFLYSPMFFARNVAIRTVTDRRSLYRCGSFFVFFALISSFILILVSRVDVAGDLLFGTLLSTDPEIAAMARGGMLAFVPIPVLVALRGMGHGCHINNGQTWYVGFGTFLRLAMMALFVFGYAINSTLTGPVLGGLTYLVGISAETAFILLTLWNKPQWTEAGEGPLLTYRQYVQYAGPLMLASVLTQINGPIMVMLINRARLPEENGAAFNLIRDTSWVMFSMLHAIQPAIVAHSTSLQNLRTLLRFTCMLVSAITVCVLAMALTPLHKLIFVTVLKVDNQTILRLTFLALLGLIPQPLTNSANLFLAAMHTRSGRTGWVAFGTIVGLAVILSGTAMIDLSAYNGVLVAVIALAVYNFIAAVVQSVGLFRGGFLQAISPATIIEQLNNQPNPRDPTISIREPTSRRTDG
ncbi:MAG: hypothetical protein GXY44_01320 [Phycisphaerales bacterium]|nr:hypothetical protein [Phycisphaerales bacterium]